MENKNSFLKFGEFLRSYFRVVIVWLGIFVVILMILFAVLRKFNQPFDGKAEGVAAPHIERNDMIYFYRGEIEHNLPEGYEYAGEAYDSYSGYGRLYVKTGCSDVLYFQTNEWDEKRDGGPQPYLKFIYENENEGK